MPRAMGNAAVRRRPAEHRYYGESQMPFNRAGEPLARETYLTSALADYASLLAYWKRENGRG